MREADILQSLFDVIDAVLMLFSTFLAIVSGYLAALYVVLVRPPLLLRTVAFSLLSVGLAFLGATATVIQNVQNGLLMAWDRIEQPSVPLRELRNPVPGMRVAGLTQH